MDTTPAVAQRPAAQHLGRDRRRGAGRGGDISRDSGAAGGSRRDRRSGRFRAAALGARRAPLFPGARRRRRRRLRALCARPQRRPRLLAIAGAVDRRPPLQPALGRHRAPRLFGRRGHGADRGLPRASDRRGAEPHRRPVPVQRAHRRRGGLAHGGARRRRHAPRGPAVPGSGRDRARDHAVAAWRGDAGADRRRQPQPAAALPQGDGALRAQRRLRRGHAAHRQRRPARHPAAAGDRVFQPLRGAGAGRLVGDRLPDDRRRARLAGGAAAALGRGLGPLAHRRGEGRDLRGPVHRLHPDRRLRPAHPRRAGVSQRLCARRRPGARGGALSARHDGHGQRRRNAAVLRPAAGAPTAIRARPCAASSSDWGSRSPTRPISPPPTAGRAFSSWRRSARFATPASTSASTPTRWRPASGPSCRAGASMRSGRPWAPSSPARSAGISIPPSSTW